MASNAPLLATIVVCTYNRRTWLGLCLDSLLPQMVGVDDVEVLVVDNNSTDDTAAVVRDRMNACSQLRYVTEPLQGLSHARNRALGEAGADWIAFLDDDARPLPGYIGRLRALAMANGFDCIGGIYFPWYAEGRVPWFRDEYASNAHSIVTDGELPPGVYASGGNCLIRRAALATCGGFAGQLGMRGQALGYGEETRLQIDMLARGFRIGGDRALQVQHLVPGRKQTLAWLLASASTSGRDTWVSFDRRPDGVALLRLAYRLMTRPARGLYRLLRSNEQPKGWRNWLLASLMPLVGTWAELREGLRLKRSGRN